jgi:putative CocE/NonD family hydrolase
MIPSGEQFGKIDLPVLSISGYYAPDLAGALYYFEEHTRWNVHADHTLVLGPYAEGAVAGEAADMSPPVPMDASADISLRELRYQWFDFILRGGAKPALLQDRVNYQVMGADTWRHAPSLAAMSNASARWYLERGAGADANVLATQPGSENTFVHQKVDLADRSDADSAAVRDILGPNLGAHLDAGKDLVFLSEPLQQPVELSGPLAGHLDFLINKRDVDLTLELYERLADGQYLRLFGPPYAFRASNVGDRLHRHLLQSGLRQQLDVRIERLASRMIQAGSRLVFVLGVNKRSDQEINLGTGRSVREEYIESAGPPLEIRWYGDSYIELPVRQ